MFTGLCFGSDSLILRQGLNEMRSEKGPKHIYKNMNCIAINYYHFGGHCEKKKLKKTTKQSEQSCEC